MDYRQKLSTLPIFFHISQVSQISDRPHYLPVILGRLVCHSLHIPLGNDRYNVIYEVTFPLDCTQTRGRYLQEKFHLSSSSSWLFAHEAPTAPYGTYIQLLFRKSSLIHMGWFSLIFPAHYPLTASSSNCTTDEPPPALSNPIMD